LDVGLDTTLLRSDWGSLNLSHSRSTEVFLFMKTREENIEDCLEMCLSLSEDEGFQKRIKDVSHEERVVFLLDNGFEFDLPEEESEELEKQYRQY
jgi:hypothetical protein